MALKWSPGCGCCGECPNCSGSKTGSSYDVDILDGSLYAPSCPFGDFASAVSLSYNETGDNPCNWQNEALDVDMEKSGSCNSLVTAAVYLLMDGSTDDTLQEYPGTLTMPTGQNVHLYIEFYWFNGVFPVYFGYVLYTYTVPGSGGFACSAVDDVTFTYSSESFDTGYAATHTWSSWSPRVTFNP